MIFFSVSVVSIAPTQKRSRDASEQDNAETDNKKPRVTTTLTETQSSTAATSTETQANVAATVPRVEYVDIVELVNVMT